MLLLAVLSGCSANGKKPNDARTTVAPVNLRGFDRTIHAKPLPKPTGPLARLRWPKDVVKPDTLLHDDGEFLWMWELSGESHAIWQHPKVSVYDLAADPDGRQLAFVLNFPPKSKKDPASILYLLKRDGTIQTVDVTYEYMTIHSPIFLRPPTEQDGPDRLYWIRLQGQKINEKGQLETQVMVLGQQGLIPVEVPLRYAEGPFGVDGYPGSPTFTLTLFRQNNVPTRLEVLRNEDFRPISTIASLDLWGNNEHRAFTDASTGVAWVSPTDYVIPVVKDSFRNDYSLRLFRFRCEMNGSHVVYMGPKIDTGSAEFPWHILPGGRDQVLVLGTDDIPQAVEGDEPLEDLKAPWLSVSLTTGAITKTKMTWTQGPWAYVYPKPTETPTYDDIECSDLTWTYP